jgi:hypothetical protein
MMCSRIGNPRDEEPFVAVECREPHLNSVIEVVDASQYHENPSHSSFKLLSGQLCGVARSLG